ncbi:MAG: sigma 54-interacting transcriptional regulator [Clostridia bacterium]|nr:sigma 54-interacting transcriptional regulator [Clostridia bacterium]
MAKAAILMPYPNLIDVAEAAVGDYPRITPVTIEYTNTERIAARARALEQEGCDLIVARGLQARIARAAVLIPVIEMRASTQELAMLVMELKQKTADQSDNPHILGIIGFFNMFHSLEHLADVLNIDLRFYIASDVEQYPELVNKAKNDGCRGVIGGEVVCRRAQELGMTAVFLSMGEESVREAFEAASLAGYTLDLMKRSNAEMSTMLDNTFSAIIQVDSEGIIRRANRAFFRLVDKDSAGTLGKKAWDVIEGLPQSVLEQAMEAGDEADGEVIPLGNRSVLMNITPVHVEGRNEGAILTFQESKRITEMNSRLRQEQARQGFVAHYKFDGLITESKELQSVIAKLRRLSRYPSAVLLSGEPGTGKGILAQCMHNESLQRDGAFVTVDCSIWHPEDLDEKLFGRFSSRREGDLSVVEQARGGTLYLRQVELLSSETQYKLLQLAEGQYQNNSAALATPIDIKLIISTEADLREKMLAGTFRKDLYYMLNALRVEIPPMRERRDDIIGWFEAILADWGTKIVRHIKLTDDAREFLRAYDWPGNIDQMEALCRRIVLLSEKRTIDEAAVREHLRAMESEHASTAEIAVSVNPRAEELIQLLNRHHGNRERAAEELGISKTTLWRRMKKYGIARDLSME